MDDLIFFVVTILFGAFVLYMFWLLITGLANRDERRQAASRFRKDPFGATFEWVYLLVGMVFLSLILGLFLGIDEAGPLVIYAAGAGAVLWIVGLFFGK